MTETAGVMIPAGWDASSLAEVCQRGGGSIQTGPFGSQLHASDYVESGIPSVMPQDIGDNLIREDNIARVSPIDVERLARHKLTAGDIVYSRRGDVERRALVRPGQEGWLCGTGCLRVRPGSGIDPQFLAYYLGHPPVREWIVRHAVGATMPNLNTKILGAVPVGVPPCREQLGIAATLGVLDEKISANERIAAIVEELMSLRFSSLGVTGTAGVDPVVRASEIIDFNPKTAKPEAEEPVYVDMAALSTRRAAIEGWSYRAPKSGTRFMNGDVLMARITPCLENGKTAFIDFMAAGEVGLGSTEFIVMRARPGVPGEFSYFLARNAKFREHAIRSMVGSSGRQRVSAADAANFLIRLPDPTKLREFGSEASNMFAHVRSINTESRTLAALRDTLLPQLMSGKLRVRDAERIVEDAV